MHLVEKLRRGYLDIVTVSVSDTLIFIVGVWFAESYRTCATIWMLAFLGRE